jgi:hypothetical protein
MVMVSELKSLREADPFKPFELVLDDGRRIVIRDRLHVGWSDRFIMFSVSEEAGDYVELSRVKAVRPVRSSRKRGATQVKRRGGRK